MPAPPAPANHPQTDPTRTLSHSETAHALRALLYSSGALGAFSQMVGLQMAVFTGFALWVGATESNIAHFVSIASFASLAQLISSSLIISRIRHKKTFVILMGILFSLVRFLIVLIPLLSFSTLHVPLIGLLVGAGLVCWHFGAPVYVNWQAQLIPEDIRARFLGRQSISSLLTGIAASYFSGWYLDLFQDTDKYTGFLTIFAGASLLGVYAFLNMARVPFIQTEGDKTGGSLFTPFRDHRFRKLVLFFASWNFSWVLANPFYNVFMLKTLGINYTTVAVLTSLNLVGMVAGSKIAGGLTDRYGSKAVLQLLLLPAIFTPFLWVFNRPDNYILIPFAMFINGFIFSGSLVSVNALLFGLVPEGQSRTTYFASWSCTTFLAFAIGPLVSSTMVEAFEPIQFILLNYPVGNLQLVFLVSAAVMIVPNLLLRRVVDLKPTSPSELIGQVGRGNLVGYIFNSLVYDWAHSEQMRARAARRMGRSKSPMALEQLIKALEDASPEVRRQAARGLGEARSPEAVNALLGQLNNQESDIRSESIEALGNIGDPRVIDPLIDALDDPDTRVQISAVRALSEMSGEEASELLFWKFADQFDRTTFPTLADVLSHRRDLRMVRPTLERLANFQSPAIRLQLLNSICRALGAHGRFYRLISQDNLSRVQQLEDMLKQVRRTLQRTRAIKREVRHQAIARLDEVRKALDAGNTTHLALATRQLVENLETGIGTEAVQILGEETASQIGAIVLSIQTYLDHFDQNHNEDPADVFLIVILWCLSDTLNASGKP